MYNETTFVRLCRKKTGTAKMLKKLNPCIQLKEYFKIIILHLIGFNKPASAEVRKLQA